MLRNTLLLAVALLAATAQAGDIYRWKDPSGVWHYSDQPVPGAERVGSSKYVGPGETQGRPDAPATAVTKPATGTTPQTSQKVREDVAADRAAKCKDAQANYQQMIASRRLYRPGTQGEQIFLTDAEIDAARVTARTNMEYYCGK